MSVPRAEGRRSPPPSGPAVRVGYLYPSGWGNLGDEAIQRSAIAAIRQCWPDASVRAFTLHPARTRRLHGIEAEAITGVSSRFNLIAFETNEPFAARVVGALARRAGRWRAAEKLLLRLQAVARAASLEPGSVLAAWRWLRGANLLLVAGGGQIDDLWGGAWGHPYALARWAWLARRARVPFMFLSVGYGQVTSWLSRAFLRYAMNAADYCSMRDEGSRTLAQGLGLRTPPDVVPDLALGLSPSVGEPVRSATLTIGLSPIGFLRHEWPESEEDTYRRLVQDWAALATARAARGDRVLFFVTDPSDERVVDDVWAGLDEPTRSRCARAPYGSVDALFEIFSTFDLVVASRLHGVLLALVARRPVVALSYERKVRAIMTDAGLEDHCLELLGSTVAGTSGAIDALLQQRDSVRARIAERVGTWRRAVSEQTRLLGRFARKREGRP